MREILCPGLDSVGGAPGTSRSLTHLAVVNPRVPASLQKGVCRQRGEPAGGVCRPRGEPAGGRGDPVGSLGWQP